VAPETAYEATARRLVAEGKKIQAIKEVRAATGWSLMEAKTYVDRL
jgi:ribosomal protein L7/L12